jgi:hypothetical protein
VPRVGHLDADAFRQRYGKPRNPVVLKQLTEDWPARKKWTFDYLKQVAGDSVVPLYGGCQEKARNYQYAHADSMPFVDYIERLEAGQTDLRVFSFNILRIECNERLALEGTNRRVTG